MSAIDELFASLRSRGQKAFMPFVTAGDPDLAFTAALLRQLDQQGCHLCEVGIPYSDPIADGPVIQASYARALQSGIRLHAIWDTLDQVTRTIAAPVVTMVSYATVLRVGPAAYLDRALQAGVAGVIVPDLPVEEASGLSPLCRQRDVALVQLVTPTTPHDRALRIAETSSGFLYYVSVTGITGERTALPPQLTENVTWLRERVALPICIGFGIHQPEHVRQLAPVADGLIVGSAIVRRIASASSQPRATVLAELADYVDSMLAALTS